MKGQGKIDEFVFVLLAGVILIAMLMIVWTTPTEGVPAVYPTSKSLTVLPGMSASFLLNITGTVTNVTLTADGFVSGWISFSNNKFNVQSSTLVTVSVSVPSGTALGSYSGSIVVTANGGSTSMPLTVNVQSLSNINFVKRSIALGDFTASMVSGSRTLDSQANVQVSKGAFSENKLSLIGLLNQSDLSNIQDAKIQLVISDANNLGNLIVDFNGQNLYNQQANIGLLTIPLNTTLLTTSNVARVSAASPGWMFWTTTTYQIRSATMVVDFKGGSSQTFAVNLSPTEISNFDHFTLSSLVSYQLPAPQLEIRVNSQLVYLQSPPLTALNIDLRNDVLGNPLIIGENNTISFILDNNGVIDFTNPILIINSLP